SNSILERRFDLGPEACNLFGRGCRVQDPAPRQKMHHRQNRATRCFPRATAGPDDLPFRFRTDEGVLFWMRNRGSKTDRDLIGHREYALLYLSRRPREFAGAGEIFGEIPPWFALRRFASGFALQRFPQSSFRRHRVWLFDP